MPSLVALRAWRCRKCASEAIRAQERSYDGWTCLCGNCGHKWFSRSASAAANWVQQQKMTQEQKGVFDKFESLRKPVAFTDREELESMQGPDGDSYATLWIIPHGCGQDLALYSQEYVTALQAEIALQKAIAVEYQALMYHMDHGGDFFEFQGQKAREAGVE